MQSASLVLFSVLSTFLFAASVASAADDQPQSSLSWSPKAAATYLDGREAWWLKWPASQRDHATACVSCHTALPYALSRRTLRGPLHEQAPSPVETAMLDYVIKRVTLWSEVEPFYSDAQMGVNKTIESRGTESILNALVLANHDAETGKLSDISKTALREMWALQLTSGPTPGAWMWLQFHNAPWEGRESQYLGATLAAIAVGVAPEAYASTPEIQPNLKHLSEYLAASYKEQPLLNRTLLLLASAKLPQVLTPDQKASLKDELYGLQRPDGGWSLPTMGTWEQRHDKTAFEDRSDGYSTGLTVLALEQTGVPRSQPQIQKGVAWLEQNQDPSQGRWRSWSLNKNRDLDSDIGKFMSDAATAFAVMALENSL